MSEANVTSAQRRVKTRAHDLALRDALGTAGEEEVPARRAHCA